jgi:predicted DNA-binding transcriptional regulator AlpA
MVEIDKRLLTRGEVASLYGIGKRFLELAPSRGNGPRFVRVGRSVRYRVSDVDDWITRNTTDGSLV